MGTQILQAPRRLSSVLPFGKDHCELVACHRGYARAQKSVHGKPMVVPTSSQIHRAVVHSPSISSSGVEFKHLPHTPGTVLSQHPPQPLSSMRPPAEEKGTTTQKGTTTLVSCAAFHTRGMPFQQDPGIIEFPNQKYTIQTQSLRCLLAKNYATCHWTICVWFSLVVAPLVHGRAMKEPGLPSICGSRQATHLHSPRRISRKCL